MRGFSIVVFLVFLFACSSGGGGGGSAINKDKYDISIIVEASSIYVDEFTSEVRNLVPQLEKEMNDMISLPKRPLTIKFADCGETNAFYDPTVSEITMCWELLDYVDTFYVLIDEPTAWARTVEVFFGFVLNHELAHALIEQYEIPVLGREEDMADTIAIALSVEGETGQDLIDTAWSFADTGLVFALESVNFADVHTTGPQRFTDLVCMTIGAAPSIRNDPLLDPVIADRITDLDNAERDCAQEFNDKVNDAFVAMGDFIK